MKSIAIFSLLVLSLAVVTVAYAEKPLNSNLGATALISPGELRATPEMWFYYQAMREYKDPQMAVRAKADLRSQARLRRIESMKWFGFSNSRPRASSDPFNNDYSPGWVANPGYYPSRWNGVSQP